jgi:hypothetical protein
MLKIQIPPSWNSLLEKPMKKAGPLLILPFWGFLIATINAGSETPITQAQHSGIG